MARAVPFLRPTIAAAISIYSFSLPIYAFLLLLTVETCVTCGDYSLGERSYVKTTEDGGERRDVLPMETTEGGGEGRDVLPLETTEAGREGRDVLPVETTEGGGERRNVFPVVDEQKERLDIKAIL